MTLYYLQYLSSSCFLNLKLCCSCICIRLLETKVENNSIIHSTKAINSVLVVPFDLACANKLNMLQAVRIFIPCVIQLELTKPLIWILDHGRALRIAIYFKPLLNTPTTINYNANRVSLSLHDMIQALNCKFCQWQ